MIKTMATSAKLESMIARRTKLTEAIQSTGATTLANLGDRKAGLLAQIRTIDTEKTRIKDILSNL